MITFETKCYENDWEFLLKGNYLKNMIERCHYPFEKKMLMINNVSDLNKVRRHADKKLKQGVIDAYYIVDDYAKMALDFFNIDIASFQGGYYYSIAELVSIYLCQTDFLIHFSSDSFPDESGSDWIREAINMFNTRNDIFVANPTWDFNFKQAEEESIDSTENFFIGYGFSDQCYLIRTEDFRKDIYNERNIISERYPAYGGELFEKRVDSYMRNQRLYRITSRKSCYVHKNFGHDPISRFRRKWEILMNRNT